LYVLFIQLINYLISGESYIRYRPNYAAYFIEFSVVCIILSLIPRKVSFWLKWIIAVFMTLVNIVDSYCYVRLGSQFNPTMVMLMSETNSDETWEFFEAYVFNLDTLIVVVKYLAYSLAFILYYIIYKRFVKKTITRKIKIGISFFLLVLFYSGLAYSFNNVEDMFEYRGSLFSQNSISKIEQEYGRYFFPPRCTPVPRVIASFYIQHLADEEVRVLEKRVNNVNVDSCDFTSQKIVFVIGESYNRNHAQLYGYDKRTTPYLSSLARRKRLFVFDDVLAYWNITSYVFKSFMSTHSVEQEGDWINGVLFPVLFKKAGYHVDFLTNEFSYQKNQEFCDFSGGFFLNSQKLNTAMFDCRNPEKYKYDDGILEFYDSMPKHDYENQFIMFHLYGQHMIYNQRFPLSRKKYTYHDYEDSTMTLRDKMIVASYDNATLYNDSIVGEIIRRFQDDDAIVIYMPDHGEEVYTETGLFGRTQDDVTPAYARQEYRIPFVIWCSQKYRKAHPKIIRQIRQAVHKPFMTDDISHVLLYLAGIHCKEYDDTRNLLSPNFNTKRPRLLRGRVDYDKLIESEKKN